MWIQPGKYQRKGLTQQKQENRFSVYSRWFFIISHETIPSLPTYTTVPDNNDDWSKLKLGLVISLPLISTILVLIPIIYKLKKKKIT